MPSPELVSAVAAAISAAAALVSLLVATFAVYTQSQATKPRLLVSTSTGIPVYGSRTGDPFYLVNAENRGLVPIVLGGFGFELAGGRQYVNFDPQTADGRRVAGQKLEPGEAVSVTFPIRELARTHVENGVRRAFVNTAAAGTFTSKRIDGRALASWARE
jgi:hypothetical protein